MPYRPKPLFMLAILFTAACGVEGDDSTTQKTDAPQQCNAFVASYCERVAACGEITQAACEAEVRESIDCSQVADYDAPRLQTCRNDINAMQCESGSDLPASCKGVFVTK